MSKPYGRTLMAEFILQGIGVLISWNSILTALDWYANRFPDDEPGFWLPILNFIPSMIFQPLTIVYGHRYSFNMRIIPAYAVISVILALTPIIVELSSTSAGFIIVCILTFIMGSANAICQTSVFAIAGTLPNQFTGAVMLGNGLSGLSITIIRLICIFAFPRNSDGYLHSTEVYFGLAGATLVLCIFIQLHLMKHPYVIEHLNKIGSQEQSDKLVIVAENELDSFHGNTKSMKASQEKLSVNLVIKEIWQYLFLVWINYTITFGMLSHVALATEATGMDYPVFLTLMILTFNFFDVLGRYTPMIFMIKGMALWIFTLARFGFWVTFILIASDDPSIDPAWLFSWTWFKFINMAIYAYSNGFSSTCSMIMGPACVESKDKDRAASIMVSGLLFGIISGSAVSFAFQGVGHIPS